MKQYLSVGAVFGLIVASAAIADDPKPANQAQPAQPRAVPVQPKATQPAQPGWGTTITRVTPARMATLEEEFETLEAHRDVKKAIVRAAEVALKGTEVNLDLVSKANPSQAEVMKAKIDVEAAKAQLEIRMAELKEVEVKIKFAKKRLDDAKAAAAERGPGGNPFPKADRKPVDPPPPGGFGAASAPVDQKVLVELRKKILVLEAVIDDNKSSVAKAAAEAKAAKAEADRVRAFFDPRAKVPLIDAAKAKVETAAAALDKAITEQVQNTVELEKAKAKLREIEK